MCQGDFAVYCIPLIYRSDVEKQIQEMLKQEIIKPSTIRMASPLVIFKKKDGSLRLACDYRYVNSFSLLLIANIMLIVSAVSYKV